MHPQRPRHQRKYPSIVDCGEDEGGGQTFLAQTIQSIENETEPCLVCLDDTIVLVVGALLDQPLGVVGEEPIIAAQVEPLRIPLGMI